MGVSNTVVSAYTLYRHLQQYCSHPSVQEHRRTFQYHPYSVVVVLGFNATLTAQVISWWSVTHMFPGFLTQVPKLLSFQSHRLLFSHASAEVRGENTPEREIASNRVSSSQPQGHESGMLTTESPGRGDYLYTLIDLMKLFFSPNIIRSP